MINYCGMRQDEVANQAGCLAGMKSRLHFGAVRSLG